MKNLNGQYQWQNFWDGVLVKQLGARLPRP
jgi:hypothetical protein